MGHWSLVVLIGNTAGWMDVALTHADLLSFNSHHNTQLLPHQRCHLHPGAYPQQGCAGWPHSIIWELLRVPLRNVQPWQSRGWVRPLWRESSPQPWEAKNEKCVNSKVFYPSVSSDSTTIELLTHCYSRVISLLFLDDHLSAVNFLSGLW